MPKTKTILDDCPQRISDSKIQKKRLLNKRKKDKKKAKKTQESSIQTESRFIDFSQWVEMESDWKVESKIIVKTKRLKNFDYTGK